MAKKTTCTQRWLGILTQLVALVTIASCSEPHQGWTLWLHTYSVEGDDAIRPNRDEWESLDTYLELADCKKQFEPYVTLLEKNTQESKNFVEDHSLTIQKEKQGLKITGTPVKKSKDVKKYITALKFFCLPLGQDPRPKDPVTWTLWKHEIRTGESRGTSFDIWQPEESYLTGWRCTHEMLSQMFKSTKAAKQEPRTITVFRCMPSTVNPWGKEG